MLFLAVRVLQKRSSMPDDLSKLTLDVSLTESSAALTTTVTDSNIEPSLVTRSVETASAEGVSYITRNIPSTDVGGRTNMLEMIPQLSPNQTGK